MRPQRRYRGAAVLPEGLDELAAAYDAMHAVCVRRGLCFRREVAAAIESRARALQESPC